MTNKDIGHTDTKFLCTVIYYKGSVSVVWGQDHHKRAVDILLALRERETNENNR